MAPYTGITTTPLDADEVRRKELAQFLKASRKKLTPLSSGSRRRTSGLRREEVAQAAAISTTWYTWLEQARDVRVSRAVAKRLANALQLDKAEAAYLLELARPENAENPQPLTDAQRVSVALLVEQMSPHPTYVLDRAWNLVACNAAAVSVLGIEPGPESEASNLLVKLFLDPSWRQRFVVWEQVARGAVAQFRAATASYAQEADVSELVSRLLSDSAEFAAMWNAAEIALSADWIKQIRTENGVSNWRFTVLRPEGPLQDATITLYTPAAASP